MKNINNQDQIFSLIKEEKNRQLGGLELIASENFTILIDDNGNRITCHNYEQLEILT